MLLSSLFCIPKCGEDNFAMHSFKIKNTPRTCKAMTRILRDEPLLFAYPKTKYIDKILIENTFFEQYNCKCLEGRRAASSTLTQQ